MINIVLPIDFSETTEKLMQGALKFAKQCAGKIFLIHVTPTDLGFAIGDMGFQYFPEVEENETKHELVELNKIEQKIKAQEVDCEHLLMQGIAGDVVLKYARDKKADYIVMGSHGRSNMYDVFVGSLTKELTRRSEIPILVIPVHD